MKHILLLITGLLVISCSSEDNTYKLEGNAIGFTDGTKIYINTVVDGNKTKAIDTLLVSAEKFSASYPKSETLSINFIQAENIKGNVLFFPENSDLIATIYKDSIASSFVTGSKQNDSYRNYYKQMISFNQQKAANSVQFKQARKNQDNELATKFQQANNDISDQEKGYKMLFVSENSNSLFSVLLLTEMLNRKEISSDDAKIIANKFSPKVIATSSAKNLYKLIASAKKADVGGAAPEFSAPTPEGDMLALKDVLGKYTIIDFWASWCKPCRRENPNVVRVYNEYHDKGLNIISVSLDKAGQKERWLKAIEDDKMNWHHISNLKGWNEPIAKMYNVRSIPATFLLDENGKIIAKNLRGNALDAKIASLLGD